MLSPDHYGAGIADESGMGNPWLLDDDRSNDLMPKLVHRRAKRIIPDDEKDDKYWEKRKRNNMAAKRSRENKRQFEVDIRNKVGYLEEDNALLRKEVMMIKSRFGIPMDQSVLTPEERAQCLQEVKNAQAAAAEASNRNLKLEERGDHVSSTSSGVYPMSMVSGLHQDDHNLTGHARVMPDPRATHSPGDGQHKVLVKEEPPLGERSDAGVFVPNGQSVYGPFNPPVVWGPSGQQQQQHGGGAHHDGYGGMYGLGQQHHHDAYGSYESGQTKLPSLGNALQDKPSLDGLSWKGLPMEGHRYSTTPSTNGITTTTAVATNTQYDTVARTSYDYFMVAAYPQGQAIYSPANNSATLSVPTPADFSRGDKHQPNDVTCLVDKSSLPDGAQVPQSMSNNHLQVQRMDSLSLSGMSASMASHRDSLYHLANRRGSVEDLLGVGVNGQGEGVGRKTLAKENDELKVHIRKLTAQMVLMKNVVRKN